MLINLFSFIIPQAHSQRNFGFLIKRGNWEQQIPRNGKLNIYFKKQIQSFSNERDKIKFSLLTKCAYMILH